jgi:hypothetical protein
MSVEGGKKVCREKVSIKIIKKSYKKIFLVDFHPSKNFVLQACWRKSYTLVTTVSVIEMIFIFQHKNFEALTMSSIPIFSIHDSIDDKKSKTLCHFQAHNINIAVFHCKWFIQKIKLSSYLRVLVNGKSQRKESKRKYSSFFFPFSRH